MKSNQSSIGNYVLPYGTFPREEQEVINLWRNFNQLSEKAKQRVCSKDYSPRKIEELPLISIQENSDKPMTSDGKSLDWEIYKEIHNFN
jgi:hypothetical protein